MGQTRRVQFTGHDGDLLDARLELPDTNPRAFALFAHCFSCSKESLAASRISRRLTDHGIAVLRFDFTGLGASEGDFANTNFSSNVDDLLAAANWLKSEHGRVDILVGHSLGGAAVVVAGSRMSDLKAVATLGAPSDADHVLQQFAPQLATIEQEGMARVELDERPFTIKRQFVEDVRSARVQEAARALRCPLLVMHAPHDAVVGLDNATELFVAARHPKSFVCLDGANHLLSRREDAEYAADMIAAWLTKYIGPEDDTPQIELPRGIVRVAETGAGGYANQVQARHHVTRSDEPSELGGLDTGPTPTEYLSAALGACTTITLRMYANRKKWNVDGISVDVSHKKAETADDTGWKQDIFTRELSVSGALEEEQTSRLVEIAEKCPVHRMLTHASMVETKLKEPS